MTDADVLAGIEISMGRQMIDPASWNRFVIALFRRCDLPPDRKVAEVRRTAAYRALNAIAAGSPAATSLTLEVLRMVGFDSLDAAATGFSGTPDLSRQYDHRLFLRLLLREKVLTGLRLHYLEGCDASVTLPAQHPWESIALHRGLLASESGDPTAAAVWHGKALQVALAPRQGATVRFIGAVIAAVAWIDTGETEFRDALLGILDGDGEWGGDETELVSSLPAVEDKIATLRDAADATPSEDPGEIEQILSLLTLNHR
jgi:hypothetical protein